MIQEFSLSAPLADLSAELCAEPGPAAGWRHSDEFAPGRRMLIVRQARHSPERELVTATWGFVPAWHAGELEPVATVGISRVRTNGVFRQSFLRRRCLVPMGTFVNAERDARGTSRYAAPSGSLLAAAGIYNVDPMGRVSAAVIVHDPEPGRAAATPVMLGSAEWASWLSPGADAEDRGFREAVQTSSAVVRASLSRGGSIPPL